MEEKKDGDCLVKHPYSEIEDELNLMGYKMVGDYHGVNKRITVSDKFGYHYEVSFHSLRSGHKPLLAYKTNSYSIQNIRMWCKLEGKQFDLVSVEFVSGKGILQWQCLNENCKQIFPKSWNNTFHHNQQCGYCANKRVSENNSLAKTHPQIAKEWHPTKNNALLSLNNEPLTPYNVVSGSPHKVWWKCDKGDDHEWLAPITSRCRGKIDKGNGCPFCSGRKPCRNNNLKVKDPLLCQDWDFEKNKEDEELLFKLPEEYLPNNKTKVHWKCRHCGHQWKKSIINRYSDRTNCPKCSDNISYPEKFMFNVLTQLNINFETQKIFVWGENKRYDFYILELNLIIETHGLQHFEESPRGKRTLKEERENDEYKEKLAKINGINYIAIDCRYSEKEYIMKEILASAFYKKYNKSFDFDRISWDECHKYACKSLVKEACDLWNLGKSIIEIAKVLKVHIGTVREYLKKGSEIRLCKYDPKLSRIKKIKEQKTPVNNKVKVICINTLEVFNSIADAEKKYEVHRSSISKCCSKNGKYKTAGKHPETGESLIWMFYDEISTLNNQELEDFRDNKLSETVMKVSKV